MDKERRKGGGRERYIYIGKREREREWCNNQRSPSERGKSFFFYSKLLLLFIVFFGSHSIVGACSSKDTLVESLKSGCLRSMRNLVGVRMWVEPAGEQSVGWLLAQRKTKKQFKRAHAEKRFFFSFKKAFNITSLSAESISTKKQSEHVWKKQMWKWQTHIQTERRRQMDSRGKHHQGMQWSGVDGSGFWQSPLGLQELLYAAKMFGVQVRNGQIHQFWFLLVSRCSNLKFSYPHSFVIIIFFI